MALKYLVDSSTAQAVKLLDSAGQSSCYANGKLKLSGS